jgi:hypothetical protein
MIQLTEARGRNGPASHEGCRLPRRPSTTGMRFAVAAVITAAGLLAYPPAGYSEPAAGELGATRASGDVTARGAFTCDFVLGPEVFAENLPAVIERDRMYMAARPGMLHKHIPFRPDPAAGVDGGVAFAGGRYLFDTVEHARDYERFVKAEFSLDGTQFLSRSYFLGPDCHSWEVIGATHFAGLDRQVLVRTERFALPPGSVRPVLRERWPALRADAQARGYTGVWLLYEPREALVSVVAFADRSTPDSPLAPDLAGLAVLETSTPLGSVFADRNWPRAFDRTHWTLTTWLPFERGDQGDPSLWPYSAFPSPERPVADGLCEPSRGENGLDNPDQCLPHCGDAVAQPEEGENTRTCPSDVRIDSRY